MRYARLQGLTLRLMMLSMPLGVAACAGTPPILAIRTACSTLLPSEWTEGVPSAASPAGKTVGDWISFGDAQTGQLDKANGRTVDAIGIVGRCEARDAEAVKRARKRFWEFWK